MPRSRANLPSSTSSPDADTLRLQKYPNRRLYDRASSRHLTHEELFDLVAGGRRIEVVESKTGIDITNAVLAQVLLEHDPAKLAAFPTELFHLLIRVNQRLIPTLQQSLLQAMAQAMQGWQAWQERVSAIMPLGGDPRHGGTGALGATPLDWMLAAMRAGTATPAARSNDAATSSADAVASLRDEVALLRQEIDSRRSEKRSRVGARRGSKAGQALRRANER